MQKTMVAKMISAYGLTVEPILKDHPISHKKWSLETGGLWWQVQLHWNVGPSARNIWSFKTGGLSWQWSLKTGSTVCSFLDFSVNFLENWPCSVNLHVVPSHDIQSKHYFLHSWCAVVHALMTLVKYQVNCLIETFQGPLATHGISSERNN